MLTALKATHLIMPLAALALVCVWNVAELRSASALGGKVALLRGKITTARQAGISAEGMAASEKSKPASQAAPDWRNLATLLDSDSGEKSQLKALLDFEKRLAAMSREELIAALDEIDSLGLSEDQRAELLEKLLGPLIEKDPRYALDRFASEIEGNETVRAPLAKALRDWAKKDRAAASQWLNKQIDAGNFEAKTLDGKSEARVEFEAAILESLLAADPTAAAARLAGLPEDQRREVLEKLPFADLSATEQATYAALIRGQVPADERAGTFADLAGKLATGGDYEKLNAFLDGNQATAEERSAAAGQAAQSQLENLANKRSISRADVDSLRRWLDTQAPGQTDAMTGKALGEAAQSGGKFSFEDASRLVLDYQKSSGNDELLIGFLRSYGAHSNFSEVADFAGKYANPQILQEVLSRRR
jgi:hypothetical protein